MIEEETNVASDKVTKFIIGLFAIAYTLLSLNLLNLMTPVLDNLGNGTTALAPTYEDVCPSYLMELPRCAEIIIP